LLLEVPAVALAQVAGVVPAELLKVLLDFHKAMLSQFRLVVAVLVWIRTCMVDNHILVETLQSQTQQRVV
jgi:hypothetical protein